MLYDPLGFFGKPLAVNLKKKPDVYQFCSLISFMHLQTTKQLYKLYKWYMCSISLFVIILLLCLINNVPSAYKCISTHAVTFGILILSISRVYNELIIKWHYALIISLHIQNGIIDIAFVNHFKKQPTFEFQLYAISKIQKSYTLLGNEGSCHVFVYIW